MNTNNYYYVDMSADGYRLPTEAERDYAERGGTGYPSYYWGYGTDYRKYSWYRDDCAGTQPVGRLAANAFGLYDMDGNTYDWCWATNGEYSLTDEVNPFPAEITEGQWVARGCGWDRTVDYLVFPVRYWVSYRSDNIGLRVVRNIQ
jgi:formylglycine-generating enzyme required for sulfatase activity